MAKFKVGDICRGKNFVIDTDLNGMECTILLLPSLYGAIPLRSNLEVFEDDGILRYFVQWESGEKNVVKESHLEIKKPPEQPNQADRLTLVSWEDCAWKPRVLEDA